MLMLMSIFIERSIYEGSLVSFGRARSSRHWNAECKRKLDTYITRRIASASSPLSF
jgi:hypothetical protein